VPWRLIDAGATLEASGACRPLGAHEVACAVPTRVASSELAVRLDDGGDRVEVAPAVATGFGCEDSARSRANSLPRSVYRELRRNRAVALELVMVLRPGIRHGVIPDPRPRHAALSATRINS